MEKVHLLTIEPLDRARSKNSTNRLKPNEVGQGAHHQVATPLRGHFLTWPPEVRVQRRCELVLASREPGGSSGWQSAGTARSCCKLSRLRSKPGIDQLKLDGF